LGVINICLFIETFRIALEKEKKMEDNKILIIDDEGREREFTILFTFNSDDEDPEMGDNYAVVYEGDNDEELLAFKYDEDGNIAPVEDEAELEMIQEVIDGFDGIEDESF